jgi:predicted amidohydrolase YtcJ
MLLFINANILMVRVNLLRGEVLVRASNGRGADAPLSPTMRVVDAAGATKLMPGMTEAHAHLVG